MSYRKLKYRDFSGFEAAQNLYEAGILTLNLATWVEFHEVVKTFDNNPDYIWRGQEKDWPLKASFDRELKGGRLLYGSKEERSAKLQTLLTEFKFRLADLPNSPAFSEHEIWAIGQHYGLPTPYLDWTEVPYIAAYFAFYKKGSATHGIIYALNKAVQTLLIKMKQGSHVLSKERSVEFIDGKHLDRIQFERLKRQRGIFTRALNGEDVEDNARKLYPKKYKDTETVLLAKILIPRQDRNECQNFLQSTNITHGTLFPDYQGAVEICKMQCPILNKNAEEKL